MIDARPIVGLALGLAACGGDVCAPYGGRSCVALEVRAVSARAIDELRVSADGFPLDDVASAEPDHAEKELPVWVAILPGADFAGDFTLRVRGLLGALEVGRGDASGTIAAAGQHVHLIATLGGAEDAVDLAGADLAGADLAVTPDAATMMPADLADPPPADTECDTVANAWSAATKTSSSCDARQTTVVDPDVFSIDKVGIARAPTGRMGFVYGYPEGGPDDTILIVSTFTGDTFPPTFVKKTIGGGIGQRQGTAPSIAAGDDGTMHVCYLDTSDSGNEVRYTKLDNAGAFGSPETVAAGQGTNGYVATAVDGTGRIVCAYYNRNGNALAARVRASGVWGPEQVVRAGVPSTMADRGRVALTVADGSVHLADHFATTNIGAQPIYSVFDGTSWSGFKQIDNSVGSSTMNFGPSVDIAVFGVRRALGYFAPRMATWDLRVATFDAVADLPTLTDVRPGVAANVDEARVAIAYDRWRQLHMALISPGSGGNASLLYLRQYPDGMGGLKWLTDLVDPQAGIGTDAIAVDLLVDARGRPHIAYYSGQTGKLRYATRTDRN